jgi:hypothetical protein
MRRAGKVARGVPSLLPRSRVQTFLHRFVEQAVKSLRIL